jgi:rRNA small subunit pseudouridine methyltransferase Nep1
VTQYFFILADAELELIPEELLRERCIMNNARARGKAPEKILLDASHHHPAFEKLKECDRRGRPDIVHFFLMLCMDSDLSADGKLKVFVHTRNNDVIAVNPETRLPPHYPRFVGLIETLYEKHVVPSRENALLELRQNVPLETLVNALKPDEVVILEADGEVVPLPEKFAAMKAERVVVIIGGFSKGTFRSDMKKLKASRVSLGPRMLKVWTVTAKCLCAIDLASKLAELKAQEPSKPRRARKKKEE